MRNKGTRSIVLLLIKKTMKRKQTKGINALKPCIPYDQKTKICVPSFCILAELNSTELYLYSIFNNEHCHQPLFV